MRLIASLALLAALAGCSVLQRARSNFWELERGPSGQAPDPATTREAVIQVYAARTVGWRGFFAVHTWIAVKPRNAESYTRYEVIGWGVERGAPAVRVNRSGADNYWFGDRPELLVDVRGDAAEPLVARVEAAVASYPYPASYRTWPGPNSNTFTAWVGRNVPELRLKLPSTAIGKDFLPGSVADTTPSGTGVQLSLFGLTGLAVGWEEGIEVNLLTLNFGLEVKPPALKLPMIGRIGPSGRRHEAEPPTTQISGPVDTEK
jgi:Protein of unknown function (DUF3750)